MSWHKLEMHCGKFLVAVLVVCCSQGHFQIFRQAVPGLVGLTPVISAVGRARLGGMTGRVFLDLVHPFAAPSVDPTNLESDVVETCGFRLLLVRGRDTRTPRVTISQGSRVTVLGVLWGLGDPWPTMACLDTSRSDLVLRVSNVPRKQRT